MLYKNKHKSSCNSFNSDFDEFYSKYKHATLSKSTLYISKIIMKPIQDT